jgi:hypothetical protein
MNNSGSTVLTLFLHEATALGYDPAVHDTQRLPVVTAAGPLHRNIVQVLLITLTTRFRVGLRILVPYTGQTRLSGTACRRHHTCLYCDSSRFYLE